MTQKTLSRRPDGPAKVTGALRYVDDIRPDGPDGHFAHGVVVTSPIARGRIRAIETSAAMQVPGAIAVLTHENAPKLRKVMAASMVEIGEFLPLQGNRIRYHGQAVAVIVGETLAAARDAARALVIRYDEEPGRGAHTLADAGDRLKPVKRAGIAPGVIKAGDAPGDFDRAPVKHDATYHCAPHHHNAMETSAVLARWDADGGVTLHAAVQWHHVETMAIGQAFGLSLADRLPGFLLRALFGLRLQGKVRLVNAMAGGAFGRNLNTIHALLACMAAKIAGTAVKVVLTREQTFTLLPYRGEVQQRVRLGAEADGRLITMIQEPDVAKGVAGQFVEPVGEVSSQLYAHQSRLVRHRVAALDLNGTGWMRAPGISSTIFAWESAMDEMAFDLGLDPLAMRLANHADRNPQTGKAWSSKSLRACYEAGAAAIGWHGRPMGGTLRPDGRVTGYGMATSFDLGRQFPASAAIELRADGTAIISTAAAEIGQGIFSALTTLSAEALGLPRGAITLRTDDTSLPYAAGSIGSTGTFSNATAIAEAAGKVKAELFATAIAAKGSPFFELDAKSLSLRDGILHGPDGATMALRDVMARHRTGTIRAKAQTGRTFGHSALAKASFGAIFTEIAVDPVTLEMRVERLVGAFACGRIIEPVIARNQLAGGMIWGLGQALCEETRVDRRTGRWVNANLAEALIPTQADIGKLDVLFVEEDDTRAHPLGMKGLAEIGVVGPAPAIANAFFDATGKRIRALPLLIEHRLTTASDPRWVATRPPRETPGRVPILPAANPKTAETV